MAAVVRVKRRLNEEPLDALLLNCKRAKVDQDAQDTKTALRAVLKFAGTVAEKENTITHLKKHTSVVAELREKYKKPTFLPDVNKRRLETQEASKNNRFKLVNFYRADKTEEAKSDITVFEIETDCNENDGNAINKNGSGLASGSHTTDSPRYVYDLYYTNSDDFGDTNLEDYISVEPLFDTVLLGSKDEMDSDEESEDSNAENNWRNDYPDESDMESVDEDDIVDAIKNVKIEDDLLSSDEGEEGFVYSIDSEASGFEEDIDPSDVRRYGEMYARFKARNKKEVVSSNVDLYYGDIDEEEYYY